MNSDDIVRIIAITASLVLVTAGLRGHRIGLSDGLRMAALWTFVFLAAALVFSFVRL